MNLEAPLIKVERLKEGTPVMIHVCIFFLSASVQIVLNGSVQMFFSNECEIPFDDHLYPSVILFKMQSRKKNLKSTCPVGQKISVFTCPTYKYYRYLLTWQPLWKSEDKHWQSMLGFLTNPCFQPNG